MMGRHGRDTLSLELKVSRDRTRSKCLYRENIESYISMPAWELCHLTHRPTDSDVTPCKVDLFLMQIFPYSLFLNGLPYHTRNKKMYAQSWKYIFAHCVIILVFISLVAAQWNRKWLLWVFCNGCFLHDRPWISLWIKSIYSELDIAIHVIASQLSGHCDVISNRYDVISRMWNKRARHGVDVWWSSFLSTFKNQLRRVRNTIMYVLYSSELFVCALECYFGVYFAAREMDTKITLPWAHKQFATRAHTLFYVYVTIQLAC